MNRKDLLRSLSNKHSRAIVFYNELRLNRSLLLDSRNETHELFVEIYHDKRLFPDLKDIKYVLEYTIRDHQKEIFTFLLNQGLPMDTLKLSRGKSTAHLLAENEFFEGLQLLIRFSAENYSDSYGYSYFHAACMIGKIFLVKRYISEGLGINENSYRIPPLHIAAWYRQLEVVAILLNSRFDPNLRDDSSLTPLHRMCLRTTYPLKFDKNLEYDETRVSKIVQLLIEHGADIESKNGQGYTPLQMAVSRFSYELTKALLDNGAKINSLDDSNIFLMDFRDFEVKYKALTMDIIAVVELLESKGYVMNDVRVSAMLSLWIQCHKDVDYPALFDIISGSASESDDFIIDYLNTSERGELYVKEKRKNYLLSKVFDLRGVVDNMECTSCKIVKYFDEVEALKIKMLNDKKVLTRA
ncbi:hypothetical protein TKK_0001523 [Trichogramma kaykai]|uniref:Ankyrin repeat protein n=1 Tax=Trichogramma kaykai TaxID=54128 RepID=A0ABD2X2J2_9HYME